MSKTGVLVIIFISGETLALLIFWFITRLFKKELTLSSVLRGMLERGFLYISMNLEITQAMTFFGALKIATRLKDDNKISNDYFLVGNLASVLLVIAYLFIKHYIA